ncbi:MULTISPECIES: LuxR C-terminal-related transcriptional regulator [Microbacterium]|uniref:LuxR C-terminal-related transcriptional regulator n=1 Tax=Microbacterium TaxID=33882 RepID=UPI00109BD48B|nr:LuxR C-terminal-related transcriptional regulator [Microbacterium sp. K27]
MIDAVREDPSPSDPALARAALRRNWLRLILESRTRDLEQLCLAHPEPHDPHVLLIRACCRDLLGDSHGATFLRGQGMRIADDDFVVCFTELLLAADTPTKATIADRAREALTECGPDDDYPSALFLLGWTEVRLRRDLSGAIGLLRSASDEARLRGRPETYRLAQSNLAFALTHAGLFTDAEQTLDALPVSSSPSDWDIFEGGLPQANRGTIAYWRGDYDDAIAHLEQVVDEGGPGNNFEALARLYLVMSIIALRREDRYFAAAGLLHGVSKDDKHGIPWDTLRRVISALLAHAEGHDDRARTIAAPVLARPGAAVAHAVLAELYRVLEEPASAAQALRLATSGALPRYARASTLVTAAALRSLAGHGADAHEQLDRALESAAPERILTPFLSDDPLIGDLLIAHAHRGSRHDEFLGTILERRGELARRRTGIFTPRESEVLAYLRTTMTAEEISTRLGVAYPTVKTHISSIYRKLGVTSRREAVLNVDARSGIRHRHAAPPA